MKRTIAKSTILAVLITIIGAFSWSQTMSDAQIQFSIQFYDQQLYYQGDEVRVKATITNHSSQIYRFRLADTRMFSMDFTVQDLSNMAVKPSEQYTTVLSENKPIFVRDVTILPGEDFSFVETLNDYKNLSSGVFMLTAYFYPGLRGNPDQSALQSNRLSLSLRPDIRRQNMAEDFMTVQVNQVLRAAMLPPDQVIQYMLNARQKNQQEAYLLYLDLESLYKSEPRRSERYRRMSEPERLETIQSFKNELWRNALTESISLIPASYEIMRTSYTGNRGTVEVVQKYKGSFFTEVKEFKYQLERQQDIWKVVSYTVTNRPNE